MKKIADFICKNKLSIIIISAILLVLSFIGMNLTKINYDILVYLPDDIETIKGQNILTEDFNMGGYSIATVENMPAKDVLALEDEIKNVEGVANVVSIYDAIGTSIPIEMLPNEIKDKLHKENTDIMFITFKESTSNEKTISAVKEIRKITEGKISQGGMSSMVLDTMQLSEKEIAIYIVIAVLLCILVLEISLDSYAVPFVLLANIGCAILFNLGTNIFLGQISYITKALVAVLQLGVTTDFSIFLYHSYEDKKNKYKTKEEAMAESIKDTFISVTGSSLTTIVGFLALCAMRLTLGRDLGIVMAKGVLLGVITVLTLFPSLLLVFDKLIEKTRHKVLIPNFNKFNSFVIKHAQTIFIIFLILLVPAYLANKKVEVYYKLDSSLPKTLESVKTNNLLKEKYNIVSPEIILINKDLKNNDVNDMISKIKELDGIDFVLSFRDLSSLGITDDILPSELTSIFKSDKYEMLVVNSTYDIATDELNNQTNELNKIVKSYDKKAIVAGEGPLMKDLVETYDTDYNNVNLFSIGCIFTVLLFVLKSFTLPLLLIIAIEFAIFINMSASYFAGTVLPFIAPITLGTIQLGATIDYAILVTTSYISKRKEGKNKEKAMLEVMNYAAPSILISGMCFFAATFGVGLYSDIEMIGSICSLISRGALISVLVVITILPSILLLFDKFIIKNKEEKTMKKAKSSSKKMATWLLIGTLLVTASPLNTLALTKTESVYSKLDYDGTLKSTIVNEQLINYEKLDTIEDYSELKDILNINDNTEFTQNENKLTWNALGKDIFYKGTTTKELPVSVKVTYMLDGEEYKVTDMLGKSGKVTIKLHYTNNDKHGNLYTPFVATLGSIIPTTNNSNLTVDNGKVVNNGSSYIIVGLATPGLYESLGLSELKDMDTITISYETTKFELSSMYSIVTPKLIDSSDLKVFDKLDEVYNKVNQLQSNMNQIEEGASTVAAGSNELKTKLSAAINSLDTTSDALTEEQVAYIKNQAVNSTKETFTDEYKQQIGALAVSKLSENETYQSFINGINQLEAAGITKSLVSICQSENIPEQYINACVSNKDFITKYVTLTQMKTLMEETTRATAISSAYDTAIQTTSTVSETISKNVANQVKNQAVETTKDSLNTLYNGVEALDSGIQELSNGISKYNNEGIKQITSLVNGNIKSVSNKIEQLTKLADDYSSFAGTSTQSDTKFVLTIDSLKVPKEKHTTKETKTTTLWNRIVNLFK